MVAQRKTDERQTLTAISPVQEERRKWKPILPSALAAPVVSKADNSTAQSGTPEDAAKLAELFPHTSGQPLVELVPHPEGMKAWDAHPPLRIGVVLSGGQAPGGHNVISGLFDYIKLCNPNSQLFGFLSGPHGIFTQNYLEISADYMEKYRNMGGFDMICSGRHKIETEEQKSSSLAVCKKLDLHGLVVIGGDDSNTNAAILAEYFASKDCSTKVVGCPKTIDGDLRNEYVEASFGFDTAVKVYSELIGNLCTDVATSQNRYHFVRLMGRSASNIGFECALQTRPNLIFVGEEVQAQNRSLKSIVDEILDMVIKRQEFGKNYGIVLVPEGLIEFIPEVGFLIKQINDIVAAGEFSPEKLSDANRAVFLNLPAAVRDELLLERDPHGNVQVSRIQTEKLLILMTQAELEKKQLHHKFIPTAHFFGYEGRCAMPSNFDANYCYALGRTAGALVDCGKTGYMSVVRHLHRPVVSWTPGGCPMTNMMNLERRKGKDVPVIKKYLVELDTPSYKLFMKVRESWKYNDLYRAPGSVQFNGPSADVTNYTIVNPTEEDLLPKIAQDKRSNFAKGLEYLSPLQRERLTAKISITPLLEDPKARAGDGQKCWIDDQQAQKFVTRSFPLQNHQSKLQTFNILSSPSAENKALRVGVCLCGQQSPGAMNVVEGLYNRLQIISKKSVLIGFKGITGLLDNSCIEISEDDLKLHRNQGGFELLGRTEETKKQLRTKEGLESVRTTLEKQNLDGLVMIGGQTTLTDATVLTEHLLEHNSKTLIVGVPATQENNLRHPLIEACIGFDSTAKCYSSLIGNLLTDAASATKYWYFVRLMGQVPSHIVMESALQTHPNFTVISEKYAANDQTLEDVVNDVADTICARAEEGKNFGTVLVPEGLLSQLPQMRQLLLEVDKVLSNVSMEEFQEFADDFIHLEASSTSKFQNKLSPWSLALLRTLPEFFRIQLVNRTPSGRVELSDIGTEQLLATLIEAELSHRKKAGLYKMSFSSVCHYFGFQGRSTLPSTFDCELGLAHGYLACIIIESGLTGYVSSVRGLCGKTEDWRMTAVPIPSMMKVMPEREMASYGRHVPMVPCAEVELRGKAYAAFSAHIEQWEKKDCFSNPGPIQYHGEVAERRNISLHEERYEYYAMLRELESLTSYVQEVCSFGVDEPVLRTAVLSLGSLVQILTTTNPEL